MVRVLIVDDEPLARDALRLLLEARDDVEVIGECVNGKEAVRSILEDKPELVLLDIQMPVMDGLEVVRTVGPDKMPVVVFATAFDEYALKAFEAHALDYILKPIDDDRFDQAIDRAVERIRQERVGDLSSQLVGLLGSTDQVTKKPDTDGRFDSRIMIKDRESVVFLKPADIDWIEAAGDYVMLHSGDAKHMLRDSMTGMESRLDPSLFVRIHRSTIVNIDRIKELKSYFHGDYLVYLRDGRELRLSRRYWSRVESAISGRSK